MCTTEYFSCAIITLYEILTDFGALLTSGRFVPIIIAVFFLLYMVCNSFTNHW